jgi:hypothetical protein
VALGQRTGREGRQELVDDLELGGEVRTRHALRAGLVAVPELAQLLDEALGEEADEPSTRRCGSTRAIDGPPSTCLDVRLALRATRCARAVARCRRT